MRRHLLPAVAILSLACSVALAGLWVATWRRYLAVRYAAAAVPVTAIARGEDSVATFVWWRSAIVGDDGWDANAYEPSPDSVYTADDRLRRAAVGFALHSGMVGSERSTVVSAPLWPAILLTAIPPAVWWAVKRKGRGVRGFEVAPPSARMTVVMRHGDLHETSAS